MLKKSSHVLINQQARIKSQNSKKYDQDIYILLVKSKQWPWSAISHLKFRQRRRGSGHQSLELPRCHRAPGNIGQARETTRPSPDRPRPGESSWTSWFAKKENSSLLPVINFAQKQRLIQFRLSEYHCFVYLQLNRLWKVTNLGINLPNSAQSPGHGVWEFAGKKKQNKRKS